MNILIFIVILAVLIFVHEFGHFIVAKKSGIRVDEFGFGFPPKLFGFKKGETVYSINLIPFGGFVKIYGENPEETIKLSPDDPARARSFAHKSRWTQAAVLAAGVAFNVIFAWVLISIGFMSGLPAPLSVAPEGEVTNSRVIITSVLPGSPAEKAGLKPGDALVFLRSGKGEIEAKETALVQNFIAESGKNPISFAIERGQEKQAFEILPEDGIIAGKTAVGVSMEEIGILKLPFFSALYEGIKTTGRLTYATAVGILDFLRSSFSGQGSLNQVTGPVGLVGIVGDAADLGIIYVISLAAFISINLAVINLIPFPALDGGRLLFVAIEGIRKKAINPKVVNAFNTVGFALLLLLMVVVTWNDISRLL